MSHFSAAEWFQFVQHAVPAERSALMQRHLDERCSECQDSSAMWKEVFEINQREKGYYPPAEAVGWAKAAFKTEGRWRWLSQVAEVARLVFDSFQQPVPAEIRGSAVSSRQFLQEAKPFVVDLRLETEPAAGLTRLIGQVLNSSEPEKDVVDVEVFLLKGEHLAKKTKANASGEFNLDFQDAEGLQLFIDVLGRKVIEVQLPRSVADR